MWNEPYGLGASRTRERPLRPSGASYVVEASRRVRVHPWVDTRQFRPGPRVLSRMALDVRMCSMLHGAHEALMARGTSGRIVVEIEPALKRALYSRLASDGRTFKDWATAQIEAYVGRTESRPEHERAPRRSTRGRAS